MKNLPFVLLVAGLLIVNAADAQTTTRLRGTITEIEGNVMSIKSRDGKDVKVQVPDNVSVVRAIPGARTGLRAGEYVFEAVQVGPDGTMTAPRIQVSKDGIRPPQ